MQVELNSLTLQRWFHDRRINARETPTFLTTDADQHIKDRVLASQRCVVHPIDFNRFKVQDQWKGAIVDLEQRSCSCREWDLDELPCTHAMAVATYVYIMFIYIFNNNHNPRISICYSFFIICVFCIRLKGMPINSLCSDFFTTGWLKQAYDMSVNPVPEPEAWDIGDDVRNRVVLPWKKKAIDRKTKEKSDAFCWGETKATNVWELWP